MTKINKRYYYDELSGVRSEMNKLRDHFLALGVNEHYPKNWEYLEELRQEYLLQATYVIDGPRDDEFDFDGQAGDRQ